MNHIDLHAFAGPVLITIAVFMLWRRLLVVLGTLIVAAVAIGLYQILTFVRL